MMIESEEKSDQATFLPPILTSTQSHRLLYIDNLRVLLIVLVVLWHAAVTYGASGTWPYQEGQGDMLTTVLFTLFYAANGPYVLGFFFLISGYFATQSLDRKKVGAFLWDWVKRLGIPLILYVLIFDPLIYYALHSIQRGFKGSFWVYFGQHFKDYRTLGVGPMWFIEGLLIVMLIYGLARLIFHSWFTNEPADMDPPSNSTIAFFALILGILTFIVRIWISVDWLLIPLGLPLALFPQFIALFTLGIVAYRRNWVQSLPSSAGRSWFRIALLFILVLFPLIFVIGGALEGDTTSFLGGLTWQSLAFSVWEQFVGVGMIIALLVFFRERFNHQSKLAKDMADAAFAVYFVHAPILVSISLALRKLTIYPLIKFALVGPLAVFVCFLIAYGLRKTPLIKKIL